MPSPQEPYQCSLVLQNKIKTLLPCPAQQVSAESLVSPLNYLKKLGELSSYSTANAQKKWEIEFLGYCLLKEFEQYLKFKNNNQAQNGINASAHNANGAPSNRTASLWALTSDKIEQLRAHYLPKNPWYRRWFGYTLFGLGLLTAFISAILGGHAIAALFFSNAISNIVSMGVITVLSIFTYLPDHGRRLKKSCGIVPNKWTIAKLKLRIDTVSLVSSITQQRMLSNAQEESIDTQDSHLLQEITERIKLIIKNNTDQDKPSKTTFKATTFMLLGSILAASSGIFFAKAILGLFAISFVLSNPIVASVTAFIVATSIILFIASRYASLNPMFSPTLKLYNKLTEAGKTFNTSDPNLLFEKKIPNLNTSKKQKLYRHASRNKILYKKGLSLFKIRSRKLNGPLHKKPLRTLQQTPKSVISNV